MKSLSQALPLISSDLDASRVAPKLYVGSMPGPGHYEAFQAIVLCAREYQPAASVFSGTKVIHAPFDDTLSPTDTELETAISAAFQVVRELRERNRVLVTCRAGQNRSALVAALAMKRHWKLPPDKVIAAIRAGRGQIALHNETFVKIIERF